MADWAREAQAAAYGQLSSHPAVVDAVGQRIYGEPPEDPDYPFMHIGQVNVRPLDTDATTGAVVSLTVEGHTRLVGQDKAQELLAAAVTALHRREAALRVAAPYRVVRVDMLASTVFRRPDGQGYDGTVAFDIVMDRL